MSKKSIPKPAYPPFAPDELEAMGYKELEGDTLDDGRYYRWWLYSKNSAELYLTYEYSPSGQWRHAMLEIGSTELAGKPITTDIVKLLMELM